MSYKTEQSKRRIEEIRDKALKDKVQFQNIRTGENGWVNTYTLTEDDFNFLVEKAELVEELEQQNKRYREALIYVTKTHIGQYHDSENMLEDIKFVVNKTLECGE